MPLSLDPVTTVAQEFAAQVDAENGSAKLPAAADQIAQDWASSGSIGQQRDVGTPNVVPQQPPISFGPPAAPQPFAQGLPEPGSGNLMTPYYGDFVDYGADNPIQPDFSNAFSYARPPLAPTLQFPQPETQWNSGRQLAPANPNGPNGRFIIPASPYDISQYPYGAGLNRLTANEPPPYPDLGIRSPGPSRVETMAGPTPSVFSLGIPNAGLMPMPEQPTHDWRNVDITQFGYDPADSSTWADAEQRALDEAQKRTDAGITGVRIRYPGDEQDITRYTPLDVPSLAGEALQQPYKQLVEPRLPQSVAGVPVRTPASVAGEFALGSVPWAAGGEISAPLTTAAFVGSTLSNTARIGTAYQQGQIDGGEAIKQLAMTIGPAALPFAIHGALAGAEWARAAAQTPAGQQALRFAASERGSIDMGVFDDIQKTAQAQASDYGNVLKTDKTLTREEKANFKHEQLVAEQKLASIAEAHSEAKLAPGEEEHVTIPMLQTQLDAVETELQRRMIPFGGRAAMPAWRARQIERFGSPTEQARISRSFSEDTPTLEARKQALQDIIDELHTNTVPGMGVQAAETGAAAPAIGPSQGGAERNATGLRPGQAGVPPRSEPPTAAGGGPPPPAQPPAAPAGGEPPSGGPPATTGGTGGGEVLPPVNQRFIAAMGDINKQLGQATVAQRAAQVSAGRSAQAARISQALASGGSASDIAAAVKNAPAGDILAEFPGIKGLMQPGDLEQLHQGWIDAATRDDITQFQAKQAQSIIDNMWQPPDGYKGPQPAQRTLLARIYGPEFVKSIPRTPQAWSIWKELRAAAGVPNTLLTSFSAHGPMNQMFRLGVTHPLQWFDATSKDLRALATHENAIQLDNALRADPLVNGKGLPAHVPSADEAMHLYDLQNIEPAGQQPEGFVSAAATDTYIGRALNRIPGIQRSKEGFLTGLNAYKVNAYRNVVEKLQAAGDTNRDHYLLAGKWIDNGTGWTDVKIGDLASGVNALFSPRNWLSKPLWLTTSAETMLKVPVLRAEVARSLVGYAGAVAALMTVANLAGSKVGMGGDIDPFSSTFGQIRLGPARITPGRDYTPLIKLITQVASGRVDVAGRTFDKSRTAAVATFLRNAESPIVGAATDVLTGKNVAGQATNFTTPSGVRTELFNRLTPIFVRDIINAVREGGVKSAAFIGGPAFLGASTNTYTTPTEAINQILRDHGVPQGVNAPPGDIAAARAKYPEVAAALDARDKAQIASGSQPGELKVAHANAMQAQSDADAAFQSGSMSVRQWKDARKTVNDTLSGNIWQITKGQPYTSGDKVLDGYYAIFQKFQKPGGAIIDKQGLQDALDQYTASLSSQDQQHLDQNTGVSKTTPKVQEYRNAVKQLGDAGFFNQEKLGYASPYWQKQFAAAKTPLAKNGLMPDRFASLGAMKATYVQAYQNANPKTDPQIAAADAARQFERIGAVKQFRTQLNQHLQNFYKSNPSLLRLATQWGFNTLSKAEEKILVSPRAPAAGATQ